MPSKIFAKFWDKVDQSGGPDACWPWTGDKHRKGYGRAFVYGLAIPAHRLALTLHGGEPESDNFLACHTCDNPNCVNPDHLWWGTNQENIKDAAAKKRLPMQQKTHCIKGHEFTEENTFIQRRASGWVTRLCRQCMKEQGARMREKRRRESEELREAKVLIEAQATRIEALEADLVEWKNQHENLLSVRQQDIAAMQAKIDTLEKELAFKNEAIRLTKGCPGKIVVRGGFYKIDCYKSKHSKQALEGTER